MSFINYARCALGQVLVTEPCKICPRRAESKLAEIEAAFNALGAGLDEIQGAAQFYRRLRDAALCDVQVKNAASPKLSHEQI